MKLRSRAFTAIVFFLSGPQAFTARAQSVSAEGDAVELIAAAREGRLIDVGDLLAKGVSVDAWNERAGLTPLMASVEESESLPRSSFQRVRPDEMASFLLSKGADVNKVSTFTGKTALGYAVKSENVEAVRVLLGAGANSNIVDKSGYSPLFLSIVLFPVEKASEITQLLIKHGADVNATGPAGFTPLATAIAASHLTSPIIQLLIDSGADANRGLPNGLTPLMLAANNCYASAVRALIKAGADPKRKYKNGETAQSAAKGCDAETRRALK